MQANLRHKKKKKWDCKWGQETLEFNNAEKILTTKDIHWLGIWGFYCKEATKADGEAITCWFFLFSNYWITVVAVKLSRAIDSWTQRPPNCGLLWKSQPSKRYKIQQKNQKNFTVKCCREKAFSFIGGREEEKEAGPIGPQPKQQKF